VITEVSLVLPSTAVMRLDALVLLDVRDAQHAQQMAAFMKYDDIII
jgi:hypothetical protein